MQKTTDWARCRWKGAKLTTTTYAIKTSCWEELYHTFLVWQMVVQLQVHLLVSGSIDVGKTVVVGTFIGQRQYARQFHVKIQSRVALIILIGCFKSCDQARPIIVHYLSVNQLLYSKILSYPCYNIVVIKLKDSGRTFVGLWQYSCR